MMEELSESAKSAHLLKILTGSVAMFGRVEYHIAGYEVCRNAWLGIYQISSKKLNNLLNKVHNRPAVEIVDKQLEVSPPTSYKYEEARAWTLNYVEHIVDRMPHEANIMRLPVGLTLVMIHELYVKDFSLRIDIHTDELYKPYKYCSFQQMFKAEFGNIHHSKQNILAKCDVCTKFKEEETRKMPEQQYRRCREHYIKHLAMQALLRRLYAERSEHSRSDSLRSWTIAMDFASSQRTVLFSLTTRSSARKALTILFASFGLQFCYITTTR